MSFIINPYVFGVAIDPDAQAFFNRVTAAGGTLTSTEQTAVNTLVVQMKTANVWTSMKAIYPMVGASAAACAQNLKSSSFTGTFTSGWTFANTGVTGNGVSSYLNSNFIPSTNGLSYNDNHISFYSRTSAQAFVAQPYDMGSTTNISSDLYSLWTRRNIDIAGYDSGNFASNRITFSNTNGQGFYCGTALTLTSKYFKNGINQGTATLSPTSISSINLFICGFNDNNSSFFYSQKECAFASLGLGLTDTQASNFYNAVQAFQTTLSRQV